MPDGKKETPARTQAQPGQNNRYATAADTCKVTRSKARAKRGGLYQIAPQNDEPFTVHIRGREAWALERLVHAGLIGCTPITEPAPRWSAYIHRLRERGIPIDTIHEPHDGEFAGTHARYVLRASVHKAGNR